MSGLTPVNLQAVAHELLSLAANLHCCNQDLADQPSSFLMQRVLVRWGHEFRQTAGGVVAEPTPLKLGGIANSHRLVQLLSVRDIAN